MFIFLSDKRLLNAPSRLFRLEMVGKIRSHSIDNAALFWVEDGFTTCRLRDGLIKVGRGRRGIDSSPVCGLEWSIGASRLLIHRLW